MTPEEYYAALRMVHADLEDLAKKDIEGLDGIANAHIAAQVGIAHLIVCRLMWIWDTAQEDADVVLMPLHHEN